MDYRSYLLRLWRAGEGENGWQASLESIHTGKRRGFADLDALVAYLRRETVDLARGPQEENEGGGSSERKQRRWLSSLWRRSSTDACESAKEQER